MYEMYATSSSLQEHEMVSTLKVLRGNNNGEGVYYYGQPNQSNSHNQQWGYEDEYQKRCAQMDPSSAESSIPHTSNGTHQGRQQSDFKSTGTSRLSQHAIQNWDLVRLAEQKRERERDREPSTSQGVSSLAFLYGLPSSQVHSTLTTSSSAISTIGSSSDGNRSPDSDDPSEAGATDHSQSSRSLCGGSKTSDRERERERGSIGSAVSISSGESSHKRSCHSHHNHHNGNNAQWQQSGYDPTDSRLGSKAPGYQHYDQDGYSNIYPTYLPQPRPSHNPSQHHHVPFRPVPQQQNQLLYSHQLQGHMQTQVQTQAQMMHARYLNYQQNVRQVQVKERGPKVAPIVIPSSTLDYPLETHTRIHTQVQSQPSLGMTILADDSDQMISKSLAGKNLILSSASRNKDFYSAEPYGDGGDSSLLLGCSGDDVTTPVLNGQMRSQKGVKTVRDREEDRYVVLMPTRMRSSSSSSSSAILQNMEETVNSFGTSKESPGWADGGIQESNSCISIEDDCKRNESGGDVCVGGVNRESQRGEENNHNNAVCDDLILDEPLGDATHALLSFCMQRNPWMYSQLSASEDDGMGSGLGLGTINGEEGLMGNGPNILYKDVLSCLLDTPLLRKELECYSEALNPSLFPFGTIQRVKRNSNSNINKSSSTMRRRNGGLNNQNERNGGLNNQNERNGGLNNQNERNGVMINGSSEGDSSSDESTAGDITDGSQDSGEQSSVGIRSRSSISYCDNKIRKRDAIEDMREFTTFASLRMQEVSDLVCEQEVRRASRREMDKHTGRNNWSRGDGFNRDAADSAAAAAFMKALETCTQTWWAYSNLYK